MALITLDPNATFDYIPLFDRKNRVNPLIVTLKYMPHSMYLEFTSQMHKELEGEFGEAKRISISKAWDKNMFCDRVVGFKNWLQPDGTPYPDDVALFYDINDAKLIFEIQNVIQDTAVLTEFQRKNLKPGSGTHIKTSNPGSRLTARPAHSRKSETVATNSSGSRTR